jgi:hypothetical protein
VATAMSSPVFPAEAHSRLEPHLEEALFDLRRAHVHYHELEPPIRQQTAATCECPIGVAFRQILHQPPGH